MTSMWAPGESRDSAGIPEARSRRVSASSRGKESKGKERATGKDLLDNASSGPSSSAGNGEYHSQSLCFLHAAVLILAFRSK